MQIKLNYFILKMVVAPTLPIIFANIMIKFSSKPTIKDKDNYNYPAESFQKVMISSFKSITSNKKNRYIQYSIGEGPCGGVEEKSANTLTTKGSSVKVIKLYLYSNIITLSFSYSPKNCDPGAHFKHEPNPPYLSTIEQALGGIQVIKVKKIS